jgi:hypothetical protein
VEEAAVREFGVAAAEQITEILLKSEALAEQAFYVKDYAKEHLWLPSLPVKWAKVYVNYPNPGFPDVRREDHMKPARMLWRIYEACRNDIAGNIAEAFNAHQEAAKDSDIFRNLEPLIADAELYVEALASLLHRECLFHALALYRQLFLKYYDCKEKHILDLEYEYIGKLAKKLLEVIIIYREKFNIYDFSEVEEFASSFCKSEKYLDGDKQCWEEA